MPPQINESLLPGTRNQDYRFVRFGGRVYVVYNLKLPNGRQINMSWSISPKDYKAYGVNADAVQQISQGQHQSLAYFGDAREVQGGSPGEHPFQKYLKKLRELHGNVSWMGDRDFMEVMLMGYVEQWSSTELQQRLTRTSWYQQRTGAERSWELDMTKAERNNSTKTWSTRLTDAVTELLGPGMSLQEAGYKPKDLDAAALNIASGKWGDPNEGFETWLSQERKRLEKINGTAAWMDRQKSLEEQRAFLNRPEDVFEQLKQDATAWLGPTAVPDSSVLQNWAQRLVSGKASDADWQQYIQGQAKALYPFLGANEQWQDRASAYKRIVEETWGAPIGWEDPTLTHLGQVDANGRFTGQAMPYDEFEKLVRQDDNFWHGPVAKEEGFNLFNSLNSMFNGVTA
jgi:hypothetical protein